MKQIWKTVRDAFKAPPGNVLVVVGLLCIVGSFFKCENGEWSTAISPSPDLLLLGFELLAVGMVLFLVLYFVGSPIIRKANLDKGLVIKDSRISVVITVGGIQDVIDNSMASAVVLPANSRFIDSCLRDPSSALGSFFLKFYNQDEATTKADIARAMDSAGYRKAADGTYPLGTTVLLPSPYKRPCNVILTATTVHNPKTGFEAHPMTICECVKNIFATTAAEDIRKLYMPVLGSGYAGLGKYESLMFLVQSILHYGARHTHVKEVVILVLQSEKEDFKEAGRLRYLPILEGRR